MKAEELLRAEIRFHGTPFRPAKGKVFLVKVYDTRTRRRTTASTCTYTMEEARAWIHQRKEEQAKANGYPVPGVEPAPATPAPVQPPAGSITGADGTLLRLDRFLVARENETERLELAARLTFAEAYHLYIGDKAGKVSVRQIWNFDALAKRYWLPIFGSTRLCKLTADSFRAYLADRLSGKLGGKKLENVTINGERNKLSMFLRWCRLSGVLTHDPLGAISRYPEILKRPRVLEEWEQEALLKACQEATYREVAGPRPGLGDPAAAGWSVWKQRWTPPRRLYPLVLVGLETGMRRGTLLGLQWVHVDLERGWFNIGGNIMKAREDLRVPMSVRCMEVLKEWKRRLLETHGMDAVQAGSTVFGLTQWSSVFKAFRTAVEKAGLVGVRFHDLRRTFLSNACRRGIRMEVAMALSDHRDLRTVLRHYRAISDEEMLSALGRSSEADGKRPAAKA